MTISQRLTRAGLTFVLFGSVAALVPENSSALAVNASICTTTTYALSETPPTGSPQSIQTISSGATLPIVSGNPILLYVYQSTDGGATYTQFGSPEAFSAIGAVNVTGSGNPVRVRVTSSNLSATGTGTGTVSTTLPSSSAVTINFSVTS